MRQGTPNFVGQRLRQGREARGITAVTLAEVIGVSRAAVSQYEYGHQSPSPETMQRICQALNLPIQWFLRPVAPTEKRPIFYRSNSSATKAARNRAEGRFLWLKDVVRLLQDRVRFPKVNLPEFDIPSNLAMLSPEEIEELASQTRRHWGLGDGPISNVAWLLENNGCVLSRFDLHAATLDAFSEVDATSNRPFIVLGADKGSAVRSRFDAAHELGHIVLHRHLQNVDVLENNQFALLEEQAHRFAVSFLLPAESFSADFYAPSLDSLRSLKERWHVAIAAMIMRISQLNLASSEQVKRLWMNLSRRKWRTKEPLDDVLEPERPRYLRKCIEVLIERGVLSAPELPFLVGLPSLDVEELAGLDRGYLGRAEPVVQLTSDDEDEPPNEQMILRFPTAN